MKLKIFTTILYLLAVITVFDQSAAAQSKNEILLIDAKTSDCDGSGKRNCLRVRRLHEEKYSTMKETIENFRFVPGNFYVLEVQATTGPVTATGRRNFRYRLRKILASVRAEETRPVEQNKFSGTHWQLLKIEGQAVNTSKAFIKFDETKNTAGGNGGCNGFGGDLSKNGDRIKISQIISTKMYCEETQAIENKFLENLEKATRYEITGGKLYLLVGERIVLEFGAPVN